MHAILIPQLGDSVSFLLVLAMICPSVLQSSVLMSAVVISLAKLMVDACHVLFLISHLGGFSVFPLSLWQWYFLLLDLPLCPTQLSVVVCSCDQFLQVLCFLFSFFLPQFNLFQLGY